MPEGDEVLVRRAVPFRGARLLDVYGGSDEVQSPTVLLWHGRGPAERDVMEPLARAIAAKGMLVFAPDWRSDAADGGRDDLLSSLAFVVENAEKFGGSSSVLLSGWSRGAAAAADIVLHPDLVPGWRPAGFVGLSGGYRVSPITGSLQLTALEPGGSFSLLLAHGRRDSVVPLERSCRFQAAVAVAGWDAPLLEIEADHAAVVLSRYDQEQRRCVPSASAAVHAAAIVELFVQSSRSR